MKKTPRKKELPFFELYDRFIRDSKSGRRLQPNGKKISAGTIINYSYTRKLLEKFCNDKVFDLRLRSIKHLTQREMKVERNYWIRFYKQLTDYCYKDCGYFDNYVGQNIKILKVFWGYCNKQLLLNIGDFYKHFYVAKEDIPVITLLPEELNYLIYNKGFEASLTGRMQEVKDVFVFGCTVALRFSDLIALKQTNIRVLGNKWYLQVRSQKTGTDTQMCLPEYAINVLAKYATQKKGFLLPRFNDANLNIYVKQLIKLAGFLHPSRKTRNKRGIAKEILKQKSDKNIIYDFCDLVTTHTMRRTAITTMLCLGMPEHLVRKISGHSPMSKSFFRYVALAQSYQDKETAMVFDKLKEKTFYD